MQSTMSIAKDARRGFARQRQSPTRRVFRALAAACALVMSSFGADAEAQTPSQAVSIQSLVGRT